jgi:hypothetical protein
MKFLKCFLILPLIMLCLIIVVGSIACFISWSFVPIQNFVSTITPIYKDARLLRELFMVNFIVSFLIWTMETYV